MWLVVHTGCGAHSTSSLEQHRRVAELACRHAVHPTLSNAQREDDNDEALSACDAVVRAIRFMEDQPCVNAGKGSNLTMDGSVECDAGLAVSGLGHGAAACVSGVSHPIDLARAVLRGDRDRHPALNAPTLLCGSGAVRFGAKQGVECCSEDALVTDRARRLFKRYKEAITEPASSSTPSPLGDDGADGCRLDTCGAVCVDDDGNIAVGTSSGGIWLKPSGRVGPAAIFGSGFAMIDPESSSSSKVATCATGDGEKIMSQLLAMNVATCMTTDDSNAHVSLDGDKATTGENSTSPKRLKLSPRRSLSPRRELQDQAAVDTVTRKLRQQAEKLARLGGETETCKSPIASVGVACTRDAAAQQLCITFAGLVLHGRLVTAHFDGTRKRFQSQVFDATADAQGYVVFQESFSCPTRT